MGKTFAPILNSRERAAALSPPSSWKEIREARPSPSFFFGFILGVDFFRNVEGPSELLGDFLRIWMVPKIPGDSMIQIQGRSMPDFGGKSISEPNIIEGGKRRAIHQIGVARRIRTAENFIQDIVGGWIRFRIRYLS